MHWDWSGITGLIRELKHFLLTRMNGHVKSVTGCDPFSVQRMEHPQAGVHQHRQRGVHWETHCGLWRGLRSVRASGSRECNFLPRIAQTTMCERRAAREANKTWPLVLFQHIDHYSRTKAMAEQMVVSANGCPLKGVEMITNPDLGNSVGWWRRWRCCTHDSLNYVLPKWVSSCSMCFPLTGGKPPSA